MPWFWIVNSLLITVVTAYFFLRPKKSKPKLLNPLDYPELLEQRLKAFTPAPLAEQLSAEEKLTIETVPIITSQPTKKIKLIPRKDGVDEDEMTLLNFATTDFLGFSTEQSTKDKATHVLNKYGCGSCGPRGFYGTFDVHLELEKNLGEFFGTEGCIVYSDSYSTAPSVIAAFGKRGDYLFVDEGCNDSILNGCHLSRTNVLYYRHNDLEHLEQLIIEIESKVYASEKRKKPEDVKRIIVSEAIFRTTGQVCDIKQLVALRNKYKVRLMLDENLSIGVLGAQGRGLCEAEGVDLNDIDLMVGSLDHVFSSIGGFCVGKDLLIEHQRLMGAGYCFSAAVAPFLSATAVHCLKRLRTTDLSRVSKLQENLAYFHECFQGSHVLQEFLECCSAEVSSICHLQLAQKGKKGGTGSLEQLRTLKTVCELMREKGLLVVTSALTPRESELEWLKPNLKISFSAMHSKDDIKQLVTALEKAVTEV